MLRKDSRSPTAAKVGAGKEQRGSGSRGLRHDGASATVSTEPGKGVGYNAHRKGWKAQ